jgi:hypothetical protein
MLGDVRGSLEGPRAASVAVDETQVSAEPDYSIIRVDASRPVASRGRAGTFIITRSGDTSGALTVPINVGGTAVNGVDIGVIGNTVTFQPGQTSVAVNVRTNSTTDGTVDLSLAQIPGAVPTTATVNISGATSTSGTTRNTLPGGLPTNVGVGVLPGGTGLTGTSTVPGGVVIDPATGLPVTVPIGSSGTGATGTTTTGGASAMPGGVPTSSSFGSTPIGFSSVTGQPIFVSNGVVTSGNNSFSTALVANSNLSLADRLLAAEILAANTTGSA